MSLLSVATPIVAQSLAWALICSIWQGLAVYALLYALLKALPDISPAAKYYLSFSAFSALFAWFGATWLSQYREMGRIAAYCPEGAGNDITAMKNYPAKELPAGHIHASLLSHFLPSIESCFPLFIGIYTAGLCFMLCRFMMHVLQLRTLKTDGINLPEPKWNDMLLQLQQQFGITRPVKLLLSTRINVPLMLGTLKPIILLPIAVINHLSAEQAEAILLHELAHIKRHDYLLNLLQTIGETILFFNPSVWLISGIIRRERECCCDDLVVANTTSPLPYAKALAILASAPINNQFTLAATTGNKNQLLIRIKRIMDMKKNNEHHSQLTIIIVAFVTVAFTIAMCTFTPSFAQKAKASKSTLNKQTVIKYDTVTVAVEDQDIATGNGNKKITEEKIVETNGNAHEEDPENRRTNATADSPIIRFMMSDSSIVWARLFPRPIPGKGIFKTISVVTTGTTRPDPDEMAQKLRYAVDEAYHHPHDRWMSMVINAAVDKQVKGTMESLANIYFKDEQARLINGKVRKKGDEGWEPPTAATEADEERLKTEAERLRTDAEKSRIEEEQLRIEGGPGATKGGKKTFKLCTHQVEVETKSISKGLELMGKEGLIDPKGDFKIRRTVDGGLLINGVKQPASVSSKYGSYFPDNAKIELTHSSDNGK